MLFSHSIATALCAIAVRRRQDSGGTVTCLKSPWVCARATDVQIFRVPPRRRPIYGSIVPEVRDGMGNAAAERGEGQINLRLR